MVEENKKQEEKKQRYEVIEVSTQSVPMIHDAETNEQFDVSIAVCKILNGIEEIKNQVI